MGEVYQEELAPEMQRFRKANVTDKDDPELCYQLTTVILMATTHKLTKKP